MNKEETTEHKQQASGWLTVLLERGKVPFVFASFICAVALLVIIWRGGEPELAKFMSYLLGGGLLILQIFVSNRRATAAEETAKAMQKTAELTEKGNIAERFKNAIEHLGNDSASIRLGGVYALHHIAQETEEYRERVFEILCAHIRETTTREGYKGRETFIKRDMNGKIKEYKVTKPSIEIQSILNLLFVKKPDREIYEGIEANLSGANLYGADLSEANLEYANFSNANLRRTFFMLAHLENASLLGSDLKDAMFLGANLQGAWLSDSKNLQVKQLLEAKTLYQADLPNEIKEAITKQKPELLEDPADK